MNTLKVTWAGNLALRPLYIAPAVAKIEKSTSENRDLWGGQAIVGVVTSNTMAGFLWGFRCGD